MKLIPYSTLTEEFDNDGGDCEEMNAFIESHPSSPIPLYYQLQDIGNDICNGAYNLSECDWNNGDCVDFNSRNLNCPIENRDQAGDDVFDCWFI